ncbi:MAG: hypothetical protein KC729_15035 [Candidatus Eisenbacteria bacterium]|uniref:FlgD/Vpr Ig-like domain-containing protein n=1 Tax=Eiseniibacteriota bacterium TaxID=2212470 RepID=A0A956M315_UNCEI|nr:hypothetical protein [Candidatus Eisenbacteria bacterium]
MLRSRFLALAAFGPILLAVISCSAAHAVAPQVTVNAPNGGEVLTGGDVASVSYTATDDGTITEVRVYYRDDDLAPWTEVARKLSNAGIYAWHVQNTPTPNARVRVWVRDNEGLTADDESDATFVIQQTPGGTVPTTLRDFELPGTQPFGISEPLERVYICMICHAGYDETVEPGHNFMGSMMAHSARDPLFYACLAIAEQDAPSSGDFCIRCHSPGGWMDGRSNPTDASALTLADRDGVACDHCHSMADPVYKPGVSPVEDLPLLQELVQIPTIYGEGQYVVDDALLRRGPFQAPEAQHPWVESPFHREGEICGTCHNVSNPAFERVSGAEYVPGPLDEAPTSMDPSVLLPIERTFSEWGASEYATSGVYAPEFAGNKPDGIVSTCQDCHMHAVEGRGCSSEFAPIRPDLPLHDMTGGNTFVPYLVADLYPDEVEWNELADGIDRARYMLRHAALLDLGVTAVADSFQAEVTITNNTGHKLPTGYPEGRRMWIHLVALDDQDQVLYESGAYDSTSATLGNDPEATVYEAKMGISRSLAPAIGLAPGVSFHFVLNDSLYKDNRIPPRGFTNAAYDDFGGKPVDPTQPGERYPDGAYWDVADYPLPAGTKRVIASVYYQTMSREYAEFLRDENETNDAGQVLYDAWNQFGRSCPELMASDTVDVVPAGVDPAGPVVQSNSAVSGLQAGPNPFRSEVALGLGLNRPAEVRLEVYDVLGRACRSIVQGRLAAGAHRLVWDGQDETGHDAGSGIFWLRLQVDDTVETRRVVRLH